MSGEFENFLVCNYGESRDKQEMSKACFSEVDDSTNVPQVSDSKFSIEMREGPPAVSSMSMDPVSKDHEHSRKDAKSPFLMDQRIDLSAVSRKKLQEFIHFVLPYLDNQQEQIILENLQSHGGIIRVDNLQNILLNMKIKNKEEADVLQNTSKMFSFCIF